MTTINMYTPKQTTAASDAEADRRFAEMKELATTLVRHIKDDAVADAVLMLTGHLLNVQLQAQQYLLERIKADIGVQDTEESEQ